MPYPIGIASPAITGIPHVGETLTTTNGSWTDSPTSYQYQWERSPDNNPLTFTTIAGATSQHYTLQTADLTQYIRSSVRGVNASGPAATALASSNSIGAITSSSSPFHSYTFLTGTGAAATRMFRSYSWTDSVTLKNAALLAGTSTGSSTDTGTLGTAAGIKLIEAVSAGSSSSTGDLTAAPPPRHAIRIRTSDGWQDIAYAPTFVCGTGVPDNSFGVDGAIYLDFVAGRFYGPKTGGAWPGTPITIA